jgi:hypothetical protein
MSEYNLAAIFIWPLLATGFNKFSKPEYWQDKKYLLSPKQVQKLSLELSVCLAFHLWRC